MNKHHIISVIETIKENFNYGLLTKSEAKNQVEGVITLIKTVDPDNKELVSIAFNEYKKKIASVTMIDTTIK
jgi:hypothetical protein